MTALVHPPGASAYPQQNIPCVDNNVTWQFTSSWNGYATARGWVRAAFDTWNGLLDYDRSALTTVTETSTGAIDVDLVNLPAGAGGYSDCPQNGGVYEIVFNSDFVSDQTVMQNIARHEMGHEFGMWHTGRWDSWDVDNPPTMATCLETSQLSSTNALSQDDVASATWTHSSSAYRQLQANYGFEMGTDYWGISGGTWEHLTSGGAGGAYRIRHKTVTSASYVHQLVNLATGNEDESYRSVLQYKVGASGLTGHVTGTLYRKQLDYWGDICGNGGEYIYPLTAMNNADEVSSSFVAMISTGQASVAGVTSWTREDSTWYDPANADGYTLDYRVFSHAEASGGANEWVYLDNLRAEGT